MVFRITKQFTFDSAHRLYDGRMSEEDNYALFGKCANAPCHGHTYIMYVTLESNHLENGMVMNFSELKEIVRREIIDVYDHQFLNNHMKCLTTAENMCKLFFDKIAPKIDETAKLKKIVLYETPTSCAEYEVE